MTDENEKSEEEGEGPAYVVVGPSYLRSVGKEPPTESAILATIWGGPNAKPRDGRKVA